MVATTTRKLWCSLVLTMLTAAISAEAPRNNAPVFLNDRHVYERGEQCTLEVRAPEARAAQFDVNGWLPAESPVVENVAAYTVDTSLLRVQDYMVRAAVLYPDGHVETALFPFTVARQHDDERIPVWRWGGGGNDMEWWVQRGYTGGFTGFDRGASGPSNEKRVEDTKRRLEDAARHDFEMGFYFHTLISKPLQQSETARTLFPDGTRHEKKPYPLEPEALDYTKNVTESWIARFHDYPGLRHVMFNSEWQQPFCVNEVAANALKEELGLDIKDFVTGVNKLASFDAGTIENGILDDDHPRYQFLQWWWQRGQGTAVLNQMQNEIVKRYNPDLLTWHEPYRLAPVRGSHKGLDCIGTWTYGFPDIKRLCYTTYLQAAARPERQLVHQVAGVGFEPTTFGL